MLGHVQGSQGGREPFCPFSHTHIGLLPSLHGKLLTFVLTAFSWPETFEKRAEECQHLQLLAPDVPPWCPPGQRMCPRDSWCGHHYTRVRTDTTDPDLGPDLQIREGIRPLHIPNLGPGIDHNSTGCHQRSGMPCLETDLARVNPSTPGWNPLHCTADPPSHTEISTQSPLNEAGMFQFKGIKSIFKMWWFPSYQVPARCTARQAWLFSSQPGA